MYSWLRSRVLRLMRVPAEPYPPSGAESSVRIFHASRSFYQLNLLRWGLGQMLALLGIIFTFAMLGALDDGQHKLQDGNHNEPVAQEKVLHRVEDEIGQHGGKILLLFHLLETLSLGAFIIQLPVTYVLVRLDYELRWYIITDRSLRIREGIVRVNEMTLTFANVQDVAIRQGPLQRLLGISDLCVRTAGGGGASPSEAQHGKGRRGGDSGHIGYFRGVDNAEEIRDLILKRLRQLRDVGLGDPDEEAPSLQAPSAAQALVTTSHRLVEEMRMLQATLQSDSSSHSR